MRYVLATTAMAVLLAAPAFAQSPAAAPAPENPYAVEAARDLAEEAKLPAGGDYREQDNWEWKAEIAKANADRVGMPINLGAIRAQVAAAARDNNS